MGKREELEEYERTCTGKGRPPVDPGKLRIYNRVRAENAEGGGPTSAPKKKKTAKKSTPKKVLAASRRTATAEDRGSTFDPADVRKKLKKTRKVNPRAARSRSDLEGKSFNLPAGTTSPLDNRPVVLSENSLHDIIALCRKENVTSLRVGTFEIHLAAGPTNNGKAAEKAETEPRPGTAPPAPSHDTKAQLSDESSLDLDETQAMIDDPVGFEQHQIDGATRAGALSAGSEDRRAEQDLRGG